MKIGKFKYLFVELQKKIFRNYKRPEDMQRFKLKKIKQKLDKK